MTSPQFRPVRRAVYALKRRYGQPLTLCRTTANLTDFATGQQSETLIQVTINRVVVLPAKDVRRFMHAQVDIARKQDFPYGGMFDARTRAFLIDRREIPASFPVDLNMHLSFKSNRWEVKSIEEFEDDECVVLIAQRVDGAQ